MNDDRSRCRRPASSPTSGHWAASTDTRRRRCACCSPSPTSTASAGSASSRRRCWRSSSRPGPEPGRAASTTSSGSSAASWTGPWPSSGWRPRRCADPRRRETDRRLPFLFDAAQARQLLDAAAALPDNSAGHRPRTDLPRHLRPLLRARAARRRGLRAAPRRRRRRRGSSSSCGAASSARAAWFPTDRASAQLLARQVERRRRRHAGCRRTAVQLRRSAQHAPRHAPARHSIGSSPSWHFPVPDGVSPPRLHCLRHSFAVGCLLRWYREGSTREHGSTSYRPSWATSTRPRPPST